MTGIRTLSLAITIAFLAAGCSHTGLFGKRSRHPGGLQGNARQYLQKKGRGSIPAFDVPVEVNDRVLAWIDFFQGVGQERFSRYLQRSGRYVEWMRGILKEEGLPQDLVYLALIESGFSNHAHSRAKAMGPWQFIRSTGRFYGLDRNAWVDERRDPEKATRAAAQYLKKLHNEFGDWYLAMAAYNAGEGRIRGAIARSGSRDFWEITAPGTRYLKPETKDYVPKFLAATLIAKNPHRFGFHDVDYHEPFAADEVRIESPLDLSVAAELADTDLEEMKKINPELNRFVTPPHAYALKIPVGTKGKFEKAYAELPPEKRLRMLAHTVRRGETVTRIARKYGASARAIVATNGLKGTKTRLKAGTLLMIPRGSTVALAKKNSSSRLLALNTRKSKKVRQNGVEWLIRQNQNEEEEPATAADAGTGLQESAEPVVTAAPNGIEETDLSQPESDAAEEAALKPVEPTAEDPVEKAVESLEKRKEERRRAALNPPARTKTHLVRRGDNLAKIAKRYGVSVSELKIWNNVKNPRALRPGKKLLVQSPSL